MDEAETCAKCKFFLKKPDSETEGYCRRFPPTPAVATNDQVFFHFPHMKNTGWCGEFKVLTSGLN